VKTADVDRIIDNLGEQMARDIDTQVMMSALGWMAFEISEGTVYGQKYLTARSTGGAKWDNMMAWMTETFGPTAQDGVWTADCVVPIRPPEAEQKRIVVRLDSIRAKTSEMIAAYDAKLQAAKNLRQSILEAAFAGAL
jgi:hypothetical protein